MTSELNVTAATDSQGSSDIGHQIELDRLALERLRVEGDLRLRQIEADLKSKELELKLDEGRRSRYYQLTPVAAALGAALFGLIGTGIGSSLQGRANMELERQKLESSLVLRAIDQKNRDDALDLLRLFVKLGYVHDTTGNIMALKPDQVPLLPQHTNLPTSGGVSTVVLSDLLHVFNQLANRHIRYLMGAKVPDISVDPSELQVTGLDTSGLSRYLIAKGTGQQMIIPDGSWSQMNWCSGIGLPKVPYNTVGTAGPTKLFIAFHSPNQVDPTGHVWLICDGKTMECYGGTGVASRPWDAPILIKLVSVCYELPCK